MLHRRFGKSVFAINEMIDKALRCELPYPVYGYFAPTFRLVEEIAWGYFQQFLKDVPGVEYNQQKLRIKIPRPWRGDHIYIQLKSTDDPDAVVGKYYDGGVLDEYQSMNPVVFNRLIPTLSDRKGWLIIIGTPRGDNDLVKKLNTYKDHPQWYTVKIKASESGVIPDEELQIMKDSMLPEEYEQELECSETAALIGSYYGTILEQITENKQIGNFPFDNNLEVDTAWDLGMNDLNTIWFFQQKNNQIFIIDYYTHSGKGLPYYANELLKKPYNYRYHYCPHDIQVRDLSQINGITREEVLYNSGIKRGSIITVPRCSNVAENINAVRQTLPLCFFNEPLVLEGVKCLRNFQRKFDQDKQTFADKPLHNWASHGADAFAMLARGRREPDAIRKNKPLQTMANTDYNVFG